MEIVKNLKTCREKLVNYNLGTNEKMLTSSSTAREVGARVNLLQAVQFVADNWREISSKTIQNCFADSGLKHPHLETPNTSGTENEASLELQRVRKPRGCNAVTIVLDGTTKIKVAKTRLMNKSQQHTKKHHTTGKAMRLTHLSEWVTGIPENMLLNYDATSCGKAITAVLYLH
jgi:hypothetical protein